MIPFNLICSYVPKKRILPVDPIPRVGAVGRGFAGKLFATMFLYEFRPIEPKPGAIGVSAGKIFAAMLLHYVIPYNLICQMTKF